MKFAAGYLDFPDDRCRVHTFTWNGKEKGAYDSDCSDWESSGKDILIFLVGFENTSDKAVTLVYRNLVLESRDSRTFGPVNVRSDADFPPNFMNERQKLPPGGEWSGYVTFDGRVAGMVPAVPQLHRRGSDVGVGIRGEAPPGSSGSILLG